MSKRSSINVTSRNNSEKKNDCEINVMNQTSTKDEKIMINKWILIMMMQYIGRMMMKTLLTDFEGQISSGIHLCIFLGVLQL